MTREGRRTGTDEAIERIPDGARIYLAQGSGTPMGLLAAIDDARDRFTRLEFVTAYLLERAAPLDHLGEPFSWRTTQPSGATRDVADHQAFHIVPARYSDLEYLCTPGGALPADVAIVQVSTPDDRGRLSTGTSAGGNVGMIESAPLVIGQVNPNMPYVFGDGEFATTDFDLLVDIDEPLPELPSAPVNEVSTSIAGNVAPFIADGVTLQFGIGAIPDAVLRSLVDRAGLGIHGGMINDACAALIDSGAVTNDRKGTYPEVSVAAEIMGSADLYRWADRNPQLHLVRASVSHGIPGLGPLESFVALQSAVEVALDGSTNGEFAAGGYISGPGGAPDFAIGGSVATGGRSIMALPSTAARGKVSKIVRSLADGAPTTLPAYFADVVATEFGAVELRGRSLSERAELLIGIAHPDHRASLGTPAASR